MSLMPQAVAPVSRDPKALAATIAALAARLGNRLVTSQAVREQHGNTTTWIENQPPDAVDRKSTRLNSSHSQISYAVFCLKKKKKNNQAFYSSNILDSRRTARH